MRYSTPALPVLLFLSCSVSAVSARTWHVVEDGSGDAPTIAAAVDSTVAGDVILVGPGGYSVGSIDLGAVILKPGTTILSESGPAVTVLFAGDPIQSGVLSAADNCVVEGLTISGGQLFSLYCGGDNIEVSNNIIHGRLQVLGITAIHHNLINLPGAQSQAVLIDTEPAQFYNNIVLGEVVVQFCGTNVFGYCNLIQEWPVCFGPSYANFAGDPLFCGVANYYLRADSPCAPGAIHDNVDCGLIGPLPVGCGTVRVEAKSWGAVKAMYRD